MKRVCVFIFLVCLLIGCATTYHPKRGETGYEDVQFDDTTFVVTYTATLGTEFSQVELFAKRRAAELTLEHGFTHYEITKNEAKEVVPPCVCPGVTPFTRRVVIIEIKCGKTGKTGGEIDAQEFLLMGESG